MTLPRFNGCFVCCLGCLPSSEFSKPSGGGHGIHRTLEEAYIMAVPTAFVFCESIPLSGFVRFLLLESICSTYQSHCPGTLNSPTLFGDPVHILPQLLLLVEVARSYLPTPLSIGIYCHFHEPSLTSATSNLQQPTIHNNVSPNPYALPLPWLSRQMQCDCHHLQRTTIHVSQPLPSIGCLHPLWWHP